MYQKLAKIISVISILLQLVPIWWQLVFFSIVFSFSETIIMMHLGKIMTNIIGLFLVCVPFSILIYIAYRSMMISFKTPEAKKWQLVSVIIMNSFISAIVMYFIVTMGLWLTFT